MTRWWAPADAGVGPDAFDLSLLEPGDDETMDLGAALLAGHRVGAAACEEVATSAIPDEVSLVSTMAAARASFAPDVVGAVSKSLEPTYAGLLTRDYFDEAERGALTVFAAATRKGVPASLAAQRAGMIYGVPSSELGRYLPLATDLKTHPQVLAEAADRTLLAYVDTVLREEMPDDEDVAKAVAEEPRRPRGPGGGQWTASPVQPTANPALDKVFTDLERFKERTAEPTPVRRQQRGQRGGRQRARRAVEATRQAAASTQDLTRSMTRSVTRQVSRAPMTRLVSRTITGSLSKPTGEQGLPRGTGAPPMPVIDVEDLSVVLSSKNFAELQSSLRVHQGERTFLGSDLTALGTPDRDGEASHISTLATEGLTQHRRRQGRAEEPLVAVIKDSDLKARYPSDLSDRAVKGILEDEALTLVESTLAGEESLRTRGDFRHLVADEAANSTRLYRTTDDDGWVVVYTPDEDETGITSEHGHLANVKIYDTVVRGRIENERGSHEQIHLDPNQVFKLQPGYSEAFDTATNTAITTFFVQAQDPFEHGINKADWTTERRRPAGQAGAGQWTAADRVLEDLATYKEKGALVPTTRTQRGQRGSRQRARRAADASLVPTGRTVSREVTRSMSRQVSRKPMTRAMSRAFAEGVAEEALPTIKHGPQIKARGHYTLMTDDEFQEIYTTALREKLETASGQIHLNAVMEDQLRKHGIKTGGQLPEAIMHAVYDLEGGALTPTDHVDYFNPEHNLADKREMGRFLRHYLNITPGVTSAAWEQRNPENPSEYTLYTTRPPEHEEDDVHHLVLVIHDDPDSPPNPVGLAYDSTPRWSQIPGVDSRPLHDQIDDPYVKVYYLGQRPWHARLDRRSDFPPT